MLIPRFRVAQKWLCRHPEVSPLGEQCLTPIPRTLGSVCTCFGTPGPTRTSEVSGHVQEGKMPLALWHFLILASQLLGIATATLTPSGVKCMIFNTEYMTCMWNNQGKPNANYSLYYWYNYEDAAAVECRRYLQEGGTKTGCWFNSSELQYFRPFQIHVNASVEGENTIIPTVDMRLQNLVKLDPPVNLTIESTTNNQLLLRWDSSYQSNCVEFRVKHTSNKETEYTELHVQNQFEFSYSSVDPEKFYTFFVSAKVYSMCATTDLWSEWSVPIYWGKNTTLASNQHLFNLTTGGIPFIFLLILLLVLVAVFFLYFHRIRVVILPQIPNPSKNFEDLFNTYNGNFSEWTGVPKDAVETFKPNFNESICYVSEFPLHKGYGQMKEDLIVRNSSTFPRMMSGPSYMYNLAPASMEDLCTDGFRRKLLCKNGYVKFEMSHSNWGPAHSVPCAQPAAPNGQSQHSSNETLPEET
ncbi:cytokine receptor common subunit gamma [Ambystoma mexicanum]|uniref:cytokine receptor common subunit gamma n=1 Tax=Ambystoma mexicanum TaxID=8296 RepID=UPI0037E86161